jgi:hypothetical protein
VELPARPGEDTSRGGVAAREGAVRQTCGVLRLFVGCTLVCAVRWDFWLRFCLLCGWRPAICATRGVAMLMLPFLGCTSVGCPDNLMRGFNPSLCTPSFVFLSCILLPACSEVLNFPLLCRCEEMVERSAQQNIFALGLLADLWYAVTLYACGVYV